MQRTTLSLVEAAVLAAICFGLSIGLSTEAVLKGFSAMPFTDANTLWTLATLIVEASLALLYLRARGIALEPLLPHPTFIGTGAGIWLFFAAWLVGALVTAPFSSAHVQQPIAEIMSRSVLSASVVVVFAMFNGTFEEAFLLGALVRGLRGFGLSIAVGLPLLIRVLYHLYQGPVGALWVLAFGLVFTLHYVRFGTLWPPVFAHILWDIVPFAQ